jgi:acyl-CoA dehydrogenase
MNQTSLPPAVEDLRLRTRDFIRSVVIPAEPRPGERLDDGLRRELGDAAKAAGVFAPHVPVPFGGQGLPVDQWSPIFQEAGYSPIGPAVLNCMAPDEGNMHMLNIIGTEEQKRRYLAPAAATPFLLRHDRAAPGRRIDPRAADHRDPRR